MHDVRDFGQQAIPGITRQDKRFADTKGALCGCQDGGYDHALRICTRRLKKVSVETISHKRTDPLRHASACCNEHENLWTFMRAVFNSLFSSSSCPRPP